MVSGALKARPRCGARCWNDGPVAVRAAAGAIQEPWGARRWAIEEPFHSTLALPLGAVVLVVGRVCRTIGRVSEELVSNARPTM